MVTDICIDSVGAVVGDYRNAVGVFSPLSMVYSGKTLSCSCVL